MEEEWRKAEVSQALDIVEQQLKLDLERDRDGREEVDQRIQNIASLAEEIALRRKQREQAAAKAKEDGEMLELSKEGLVEMVKEVCFRFV